MCCSSDGAWVVTVADGLGGHSRGSEAAEAAISCVPRRIADTEQMVSVFQASNAAVTTLCGRCASGELISPWIAPMSPLCVAAWSPAGVNQC